MIDLILCTVVCLVINCLSVFQMAGWLIKINYDVNFGPGLCTAYSYSFTDCLIEIQDWDGRYQSTCIDTSHG